jgi:hypothetical protein
MTKIRELIKSICNIGGPFKPNWYSEDGIEKIMQEYARLMCDEQKMICIDDYLDNIEEINDQESDVYGTDIIKNSSYPEELQ